MKAYLFSTSSSRRPLGALLIAGLLLVSACGPVDQGARPGQVGVQATSTVSVPMATISVPAPTATIFVPAPTPTVKTVLSLTEAALKNGKYELPDAGAFQLVDGRWEKKTGEGASEKRTVGFTRAGFGDLNKDGAIDAAVILWLNTGGSGSFVSLVAVLNQEGTPKQVAVGSLGDRVVVESLSIVDGKIVAAMVVHGPKDPLCCPTQQVTRTYQLEGSSLKLVSGS